MKGNSTQHAGMNMSQSNGKTDWESWRDPFMISCCSNLSWQPPCLVTATAGVTQHIHANSITGSLRQSDVSREPVTTIVILWPSYPGPLYHRLCTHQSLQSLRPQTFSSLTSDFGIIQCVWPWLMQSCLLWKTELSLLPEVLGINGCVLRPGEI